MKKFFMACVLALMVSIGFSNAQAQQNGSANRPQRARVTFPTTKEGIDSAVVERVGRMRTALVLTDKQSVEIIKILRQSYTDRAKYAGRDFRSMSEDERKIVREQQAKTEAAIKVVLTDQQKVKYTEFNPWSSHPRGDGSADSRRGGTGRTQRGESK